MGSQSDLDQGGTNREWVKGYLGSSVGWVNAPVRNILKITVAGTYHLDESTSLVEVYVNGVVTIVLPSSKPSPASAQAQPGTYVQNTVTVVDAGGFAGTQNIIIQPLVGETIMGSASITISINYGGYTLQPFGDIAQWNAMPPMGGGGASIPGGAANSIQFNNSGVFGGITASAAGQALEWNGVAWTTVIPGFINVLLYGFDPTGVGDNAPLWGSVIAALSATGGTIFFPRGKYRFNSAITLGYPTRNIYHVTILGEGADASILFFSNNNGLTVQYNNNVPSNNPQGFSAQDVSFTTGAAPAAGFIGLNLTQQITNTGSYAATNDFFRVAFRGDDGYTQTNGWNLCLRVNDVSNVNIDSCIFNGPAAPAGTGLAFGNYNTTGLTSTITNGVSTTFTCAAGLGFIIPGVVVYNFTTGGTIGVVQTYSAGTVTLTAAATAAGASGNTLGFGVATGMNVTKTVFQQFAIGCEFDNGFQGFVADGGSQWNGCGIGIYVPATESIDSMLMVTNCQFGQFATSSSGITLSGTLTTFIVQGCLFLLTAAATNSNAINQLTSSNTNIANNELTAGSTTGTVGVSIGGTAAGTGCFINHNIIGGFGTGINLASGAAVYARPNRFLNCTTAVLNASTSSIYGTNFTSAKPSTPASTTSTTGIMMGLGGTCSFPPFRTVAKVTFNFTLVAISASTAQVSVFGRYGTGTPPAYGAAITGTAFGGSIGTSAVASPGTFAGVTITDVITGLNTSAAYWFDIAVVCVSPASGQPTNLSFDAYDMGGIIYA